MCNLYPDVVPTSPFEGAPGSKTPSLSPNLTPCCCRAAAVAGELLSLAAPFAAEKLVLLHLRDCHPAAELLPLTPPALPFAGVTAQPLALTPPPHLAPTCPTTPPLSW
jgi:hypothetical protein